MPRRGFSRSHSGPRFSARKLRVSTKDYTSLLWNITRSRKCESLGRPLDKHARRFSSQDQAVEHRSDSDPVRLLPAAETCTNISPQIMKPCRPSAPTNGQRHACKIMQICRNELFTTLVDLRSGHAVGTGQLCFLRIDNALHDETSYFVVSNKRLFPAF
jgi:hypothetical protein